LKPTAIRQSLLLALYGSAALAALPTSAGAQTTAPAAEVGNTTRA